MAGRGPAPKPTRRRRPAPARGEYKPTPGIGWQNGEIPACPVGLMPASQEAWTVWMHAWFASHWSPDDLPALRQLVRLYDQVERGEFQRAGELRLQMDTYGVTPKGQQDRRWAPPKPEAPEIVSPAAASSGRYGHLRAVGAG